MPWSAVFACGAGFGLLRLFGLVAHWIVVLSRFMQDLWHPLNFRFNAGQPSSENAFKIRGILILRQRFLTQCEGKLHWRPTTH